MIFVHEKRAKEQHQPCSMIVCVVIVFCHMHSFQVHFT